MHRGLFTLIVALSLAPGASASIVFDSDGPSTLRLPYRYSIAVDGGGRVQLPLPQGTPSPDGSLVARTGGAPYAPTVEVLPATGGSPRTVVAAFPEPGGLIPVVSEIEWSPDARWLAVAVVGVCRSPPSCGNRAEVWAARVDGAAVIRLAEGREPAWAPDSRRLAYVAYSRTLGRDAIFVVRPAGATPRLLAAGTAPAWSPRGDTIAFAGRAGPAIVGVPRQARPRLLERGEVGSPPVWSPDGRRVAYTIRAVSNQAVPADQAVPAQLNVANVRTRSVLTLRIGLTADAVLALPTWSPDGRRVAYVASSERYARPGLTPVEAAASPQIFVVASTSSIPRQVTHELPWGAFTELAWSRDGMRILYTVEQTRSDRELYAIEPDGSCLVQLTDDLLDEVDPAWSPDGRSIVFERTNALAPFLLDPYLFVLDTRTRSQRKTFFRGATDLGADAAWSPDGRSVAFVAGPQLVVADATGGAGRSFGTLGSPQHPTWSPDSSTIVFSDRSPTGQRALFAIGRDGRALRQLTSFPEAASPAWSPDGDWIAFVGSAEGPIFGTWVMRADGSGARRVAPAVLQMPPAWAPDSRRLVYVGFDEGGTSLRVVNRDGSGDQLILAGFGRIEHPDWSRMP